MTKHTFKTNNELATIAKHLNSILKPPSLILASGDLGTGKTWLAKNLATTLGINPTQIQSPTFGYLRSHTLPDNITQFHHLDLYLTDLSHLQLIESIRELSHQISIIYIEWPEKIPQIPTLFPNHQHLHLNLKLLNNNTREITINQNNHH